MRMGHLRRDSEGVASTVATVFSLLVFLIFFQLVVLTPIPARQYDAEWVTSRDALASFELTRSVLAGPSAVGTSFSVPIPIGTPPVSPFAAESSGHLSFRGGQAGPSISFRYVPDFLRSQVTRIDQDVILAIDSSGSMVWNDPLDLRISGAQEYVERLRCPDHIAIVDFDTDAHLVRRNLGPGNPRHHLTDDYNNCNPNYARVQDDLETIDSAGGTNFWQGLLVANDEFVAYGDHRNQWVIILLTDGINSLPIWDVNAMAESNRSRNLGIVIYTIGLGDRAVEPDDVDEAVLTWIAENTGGTYYAAPNAGSLKWIYHEIANRYTSTFSCSNYVTLDASVGSVELSLGSQEYPSQTLRFEGGGLSLVQPGGAELREGLPFDYQPIDASSGSIGVTLMSFVGEDVSTTGTGHEIMRATVVARDLVAQQVHRINLTEEAEAAHEVEISLELWASLGAATDVGAQAVINHTDPARASIARAQENYTSGDVSRARIQVQQAKTYLANAIIEVDNQTADLQIQNWLGSSTKDDIRVTACRLDQWLNWYEGLTFTIDSPAAAGWARWFEAELETAGALVSVSHNGNIATVIVHVINEYVIDHRIVEVSFGL